MLFGSTCASTVHSVHDSISGCSSYPRFSLLPLCLERQRRVPGSPPHSIAGNFPPHSLGKPQLPGWVCRKTAIRAVGYIWSGSVTLSPHPALVATLCNCISRFTRPPLCQPFNTLQVYRWVGFLILLVTGTLEVRV